MHALRAACPKSCGAMMASPLSMPLLQPQAQTISLSLQLQVRAAKVRQIGNLSEAEIWT